MRILATLAVSVVASAVLQSGSAAGLYSYGPDGASGRQEVDYARIPRILAADALYLAFDGSSSADNRIVRYSGPGQSSTLLALGDKALPSAMAFDGAALFFYSADAPGTIQRLPSGGTPSLFVQEDVVADLVADTTNLYALTVTGNLVAHPLAGGAPHVLGTGLAGARRLAADDAALYVAAAGLAPTDGRIIRLQKSDGVARDVATKQASPVAIAVVASGVYWANAGDGSVMRARRK